MARAPHSAEVLSAYFQNHSCDPFSPRSTPCELGNYVSYSINVSSVPDVVAGIKFAREKNVRLVVKNTGHDFIGRSTARGALALWTRSLKSIDVISSYTSKSYHGPAVKIGAGVTGGDAAAALSKIGYRMVGGMCPSVGAAGGYTQGGGHSMLTGLYGLGADNALEWEVVTTEGKHVIATPTQNSDLYWALSGGGPGTYGIVISLTTRLFKEGPVGGASFTFNATTAGGEDAFWKAVDVFHSHLQPIVDSHGIIVTYRLTHPPTLLIHAITAPDRTADQVEQILTPMTSALAELGLTKDKIGFTTDQTDSYYNHWMTTVEPELKESPSSHLVSGRFISRKDMRTNAHGIGQAIREATANGHFGFVCNAINAQKNIAPPVSENAVQPYWREALLSCIIASVWDWSIPFADMAGRQEEMTKVVDPLMKSITPGSGAYLNEANVLEPDWQKEFYGSNYARLKKIKEKWDPKGLLYGATSVGSESSHIDAEGRLCKNEQRHHHVLRGEDL
ncbi:hypothetical protein ACEPPN_007479 [Leptodophora sp. 'Broadleaf-Isolate-01']